MSGVKVDQDHEADLVDPPIWLSAQAHQGAVGQLKTFSASPVHAYLFVGPRGVGKEEIAHLFATALVCPERGCGTCENCRLATANKHPDLITVERTGSSISVDQARLVSAASLNRPKMAKRLVCVLHDFETVDEAAPALLKTIEEPPPDTVFIILTESVTPKLVTIASRCVEVRFGRISDQEILDILLSDGVGGELAQRCANISRGRLDIARRASRDSEYFKVHELFRAIPQEITSNGNSIILATDQILSALDRATQFVTELQEQEAREHDELVKQGHSSLSRGDLLQRQKRELKRERLETLLGGLASLASYYRDQLVSSIDSPHERLASYNKQQAMQAIELIDQFTKVLDRNPNETMLIEALFTRLSGLA